MAKINRFFYVKKNGTHTVHLRFGRTHAAGDILACGRHIGWPGWRWLSVRNGLDKLCSQCAARAPKGVKVQRTKSTVKPFHIPARVLRRMAAP